MTALDRQTLTALKARSRQAAAITLLGGLLVLMAIGYSAWQLRTLSARKAQLQAENARAQAELRTLERNKVTLQADIRTAQDTLARIRLQLATDNVTGARQTLAQAASAKPAAASVRRVFFQLRSLDQSEIYARCRKAFSTQGYRVPSYEMVPDRGPKTLNVRYFRAAEREEATRIGQLLETCAGGKATLSLIGGYDVKPNQYEVWFAPMTGR